MRNGFDKLRRANFCWFFSVSLLRNNRSLVEKLGGKGIKAFCLANVGQEKEK